MSDTPDDVTDDTVAQNEAPEPEQLHGVPVETRFGQRVAFAARDQLVDLVTALRDDGYLMCLDVTAVDYLTHPPRDLPEGIDAERFEVVVILISHAQRDRIRIRVQVPADDPVVPSLFQIYPGTEAPEREVFDLFGIAFEGHPDLTRILMPEDWVGHPLRKDYGVGDIPVQFKAPSER